MALPADRQRSRVLPAAPLQSPAALPAADALPAVDALPEFHAGEPTFFARMLGHDAEARDEGRDPGLPHPPLRAFHRFLQGLGSGEDRDAASNPLRAELARYLTDARCRAYFHRLVAVFPAWAEGLPWSELLEVKDWLLLLARQKQSEDDARLIEVIGGMGAHPSLASAMAYLQGNLFSGLQYELCRLLQIQLRPPAKEVRHA